MSKECSNTSKVCDASENIEQRVSKVQESLNKRLAGIEANRPTISQKLHKIENKLDSLTKIEAKLDRLLEEK